ncbi:MAG: ribosome silencing factor [Alphaproteobacteria bacterium]|nr:ribosome silencing factor [Alphaproteobacteria bacterium]
MTYKTETQKIITFVVKKLDAGKAEKIVKLDVRKLSSLTDVMIIATGTSTRHVMALAHHLVEDLKKQKILPLNDIHQGDGNWALVDLGSVLVHIFTDEARLKYDLENLWRPLKSTRTRKAPQKSA